MDLKNLDPKFLEKVTGGSNPFEDAFWDYVEPLLAKYNVPNWPALKGKCTPEEWEKVLELFNNFGH